MDTKTQSRTKSAAPKKARGVVRATTADNSRVSIPRRGGRLCERRELLASLDESLQTRVTLIIAPAGYGKTTLLAQWCERLENLQTPVAYYSASERDREPALFLGMIARALARAGVEIDERRGYDDDKPSEDIALDQILLALELSGQPLVFIVDDFERVNEPAIAGIITRFVDAAPVTVHFVMASRVFPAIPLSTLQLEGKLRLIDTYQLRLRPDELAWMLELDPAAQEVQDVAARTQGWPVTAELYRLWRSRHRAHDARATFGGHVAEVHNYLAEQLFSSLPPEQFELLIDIADREEVSAEQVDAMRMRQDSGRLLPEIARNMSSLMWTGQDKDATVYRLHPLLLEHLRQSLGQDVARRKALAVNAARWFLERRRFPEAVRAALESRDEQTFAHVVRALRPVHILIADGATTLRLILRELPEDVVARHPRLQIMAAMAHFKTGLFSENRKMLERVRVATRDFSADPDGHADWLMVEGNLVELIFTCQVSRLSRRVDNLCDTVMAGAADDATIWGAVENVKMLVHQIRGDLDAADAAILRARNIYNTVALSRYGHTQIFGHEVLILLARGRLRRAADLIANYQKQPGFEIPDDLSTPTLLKMIVATIQYEQHFSDAAVEALKRALAEHSKSESWSDQYAIAYPSIALRLFIHEGAAAVFAYIDEARAHAQRTCLEAVPDMLRFLEIEYRVRGGELDQAETLADRIGLDAIAAGTDEIAADRGWRETDFAITTLIRLRLAQQRPADALAAARLLAQRGAKRGRLRTEVKGLIFTALALNAQNKPDAAGADLLKAVLLAYPESFVAPFAEEGLELLPMIETLIASDGIDAYARQHINDVHRAISNAMIRSDSAQLNAREREIVRHLADGLTNKVIARRVGITEHTVKFHLKKVFSKLGVSSRRAAVAKVQANEIK